MPLIVCGDIGGTKVHLVRIDPATGSRVAEQRTPTSDIEDLTRHVAEWVTDGPEPVAAVVLGVAGPVVDGRVDGANLPWGIDEIELSRRCSAPARLLNDLEASGLGLDALAPDALVTLHEGIRSGGVRALLSPGTGLGEAVVLPDIGAGPRAVAGEGGHADFTPRTDEEIELLRWMRSVFGRATQERVLSGQGLANLYVWLRDSVGVADDAGIEAAPGDPAAAAAIGSAAVHGTSMLCRETVRVWAGALGAEAGNMALRSVALGGLYLGGGIPARLLPLLREGPFLEAYLSKEPQRAIVERIPVYVITDPETPIYGAERVARSMMSGAA